MQYTNKKRMNGEFIETAVYKKILRWAAHGDPSILILYGPPGNGKTVTMQHLADVYSGQTFWITATRGTSLELLLGHWELRGGETVFVEGELLRGLTTADGLVIIDDAHLVAPELQTLNGVGDSTRRFTVPALSQTLEIAEGVRLVLIANPPPRTVPSWERDRWLIPEQIRDRARLIRVDSDLTVEEEIAITQLYFPQDFPKEIMEGLVELARNLRLNTVLASYTPSLRAIVMVGKLLSQGLSLGEAYLEAIAYKFDDPDEYAVSIEAFTAKFGVEPREKASVKLAKGGDHAA